MNLKTNKIALLALLISLTLSSFAQSQTISSAQDMGAVVNSGPLFPEVDQELSGIRSGPNRGKTFTAENFIKRSKEHFILQTLPADNQGRHGFCHIFGRVTAVEDYIFRTSGKKVQFSRLWIARKWFEMQIDAIAADPKLAREIHEGGWAFVTSRVIDRYGLVPEEAYPYNLKNGITGSDDPQFSALKAKVWAERQALMQKKITPDVFKAKLMAILDKSYGKAPETFFSQVDNKWYTPTQYRDAVLPFEGQTFESMTNSVAEKGMLEARIEEIREKMRTELKITEVPDAVQNVRPKIELAGELDALLARIKVDLHLGFNPTISVLVLDQALKRKEGMFTTIGMKKDLGLPADVKITREMLLKDAEALDIGGHLMEVKGYIADAQGNVRHLIVKNSWSGVTGYKGDYVLTYDYLQNFMMEADVLSEAGAQLIAKQAILNSKFQVTGSFLDLTLNPENYKLLKNEALRQMEAWVKLQKGLTAEQFSDFLNKEIMDKFPSELRLDVAEHLKSSVDQVFAEIKKAELERVIKK